MIADLQRVDPLELAGLKRQRSLSGRNAGDDARQRSFRQKIGFDKRLAGRYALGRDTIENIGRTSGPGQKILFDLGLRNILKRGHAGGWIVEILRVDCCERRNRSSRNPNPNHPRLRRPNDAPLPRQLSRDRQTREHDARQSQ